MRNENMLSVIALVITCACEASRATIINVPGDQPTIQAGINAAVNGDEVVIADGTYTGAGNVNCNFNGKLITVRSASGNAEACTVDCEDAASTRGFNFENGETNAAVLKDITITGATLNGIRCVSASPVIAGCRLVANGGSGGAGMGSSGGSPMLVGCLFYDNHTTVSAGAASLSGSPIIDSCKFISNSAGINGGALSLNGPAQVVNCLFNSNSADVGGAVSVSGPTPPVFSNCTFVANEAVKPGPAGSGGAVRLSSSSSATLRNCILYNNVPDQFSLNEFATINVSHSNVEDQAVGATNIDDGPFFTDALGLDDIPGTLDDDYSIRSFSPCADSGDNTAVPVGVLVDLAGNPRFVDDPNSPDTGIGTPPLVDMGCYELQPAAIPPDPCPADSAPPGGDGAVNVLDLLKVINTWGACP